MYSLFADYLLKSGPPMIRKLITIFIILFITLGAGAQAAEEFFRARVTRVFNESIVNAAGHEIRYHTVEVSLNGQKMEIANTQTISSSGKKIIKPGDEVVVVKFDDKYQIIDQYRIDRIAWVVGGFFVLVIALARKHGIGSIIGMVASLFIILKFIVPGILDGGDPLLIGIVGSVAIMTITIYLAHGFSAQTTMALLSTYASLILVGVTSLLAVALVKLTGMGSEEAYGLQFGATAGINLQGLLLGGIMIGACGVLDDITTSLSATVFEIYKANPKLKLKQLMESGMRVGREHISSLVNTLVLAYAGSSLPVFLYLVLNVNNYPTWMLLNSEFLVEEVVRTIAGSVGLVAAVPITAFLAAWYITRLGPILKKA